MCTRLVNIKFTLPIRRPMLTTLYFSPFSSPCRLNINDRSNPSLHLSRLLSDSNRACRDASTSSETCPVKADSSLAAARQSHSFIVASRATPINWTITICRSRNGEKVVTLPGWWHVPVSSERRQRSCVFFLHAQRYPGRGRSIIAWISICFGVCNHCDRGAITNRFF